MTVSAAAVLRVDLDALSGNFRSIRDKIAPSQLAAVVKADAYGLGAPAIVRALAEAGCRHFFVAQLCEALDLAPEMPVGTALYILNGLPEGAEALCADVGAIPVLNSLDQIDRWAASAGARGLVLPALLQVDSGMARLGLTPPEVSRLLAEPHRLSGIALHAIMSHLACADDPGAAANASQRATFQAIATQFPGLPRSLDNSGGALLDGPDHLDIARAGIALYGGAPHAGGPNPMARVVALEARIIQIRDLAAGCGLGYGLTGIAPHDRRIATIGVGYADGWPRNLGNRGCGYIAGIRVPIVGRVSMDSLMLDVTEVPPDALRAGAMVELLGANQSIDDVARDADTIAYEILTRLGPRYARRYSWKTRPIARSVEA